MMEDRYPSTITNVWIGKESSRNENIVLEWELDKFMRLLKDADTEIYPV